MDDWYMMCTWRRHGVGRVVKPQLIFAHRAPQTSWSSHNLSHSQYKLTNLKSLFVMAPSTKMSLILTTYLHNLGLHKVFCQFPPENSCYVFHTNVLCWCWFNLFLIFKSVIVVARFFILWHFEVNVWQTAVTNCLKCTADVIDEVYRLVLIFSEWRIYG